MDRLKNWVKKYWLVIAIGAGIMAALSAVLLSLGVSVWFDEGYSILIAKEPISQLLAHTAVDAHPPLYYLLLKWWGELFAFDETALRALSAIFAGVATTLGLMLTRRLFGLRAAVMALPVLLLAPFVLRYGYEIRMYSLMALIGVGATYALVLARDTKRIAWWAVYAVLVALGMYTLYIGVVIWVVHAIWLTWISLKDKQPFRQWKWVWAYVGSVVLFLPYMSTFFGHLATSVLSGVGKEVNLTQLANVVTVLSTSRPEWATGGWVSLVVLTLIIGLIAAVGVALRTMEVSQRRSLLLYGLLAGVPLLFFAVLSLPPREPIFLPRYLSHVAIWIYLFLAVVLAQASRVSAGAVRRYGTYGLLLLVLGYGVFNLAADGNVTLERAQTPQAEQVRKALAEKEVQCTDDTVIVADGPYVYIETIYYYDECDMRFHYPEDFAYRGGYAPLSGSDLRIESTKELNAKTLVHLRETNPELTVDGRYGLVSSSEYNKQFLDIYQLK